MKHSLVHKKDNGFDVIEHGTCTFLDAQELVEIANAEEIGGHGDWVLPDSLTAQALRLVNGGFRSYAWTSSPCVGRADLAQSVDFGNGDVGSVLRDSTSFAVRLVRASQCLALGQAAHRKSIREGRINMVTLKAQPSTGQQMSLEKASLKAANGFNISCEGPHTRKPFAERLWPEQKVKRWIFPSSS